MAKANTVILFRQNGKKSLKRHKKRDSPNKGSKNYKKKNVGQGR
jgi:hypothetical protein